MPTVPPERLLILNHDGQEIKGTTLGPYDEESHVNLTCIAIGGELIFPKCTDAIVFSLCDCVYFSICERMWVVCKMIKLLAQSHRFYNYIK